jgi:hypothetical protein
MTVPTTEDQTIHTKALRALAHFQRFGDRRALLLVVKSLPKTNRREALLRWVQTFSNLRWNFNLENFERAAEQPLIDLAGAESTPFWKMKVKQIQRKHVSGNDFDADYFFDKMLAVVDANIASIPAHKLETTILALQKMLTKKQPTPVVR